MKIYKILILLSVVTIFQTKLIAGPFNLVYYPAQDPIVNTLRSALFYPGDKQFSFWHKQFFMESNFYDQGFVYDIDVLKDRPSLSYKLWLQPKPSNLITVLPGLGTNYTGISLTALAEVFYLQGYSVLALSSVFNWEFYESASSTLTPGYTPVDSLDVYYALTKIINHLEKKYENRIKENILVGYSLGALHTLYIADYESKHSDSSIGYKRYLALNPPVNVLYSLKIVDDFYLVADSWTQPEITKKMYKGMRLYRKVLDKSTNTKEKLPFTIDEAKYIIGLSFHLSLVELISSIHERHDFGILKAKSSWFSRSALYKEIDNYTFYDYLLTFFKKNYAEKTGKEFFLAEYNKRSGLKAIESTLRNNEKIRVIHTENDFLLKDQDRKWLDAILGDRITSINKGGHLGYLYNEQALELISKNVKLPEKK
ncbi:MAG: hypothetical protein GY756_26515 [bacterium]|nr:hypothetical protein [bacterium]